MISEGSCDTEDWSNNSENSALRHRNKLHFNSDFKLLQYHFYCFIEWSNKCSLGRRKRLLSKTLKYLPNPKRIYHGSWLTR